MRCKNFVLTTSKPDFQLKDERGMRKEESMGGKKNQNMWWKEKTAEKKD